MLARLLHWFSVAFLWDVIVMMNRPAEEKWMDDGSQVGLFVLSCLAQFFVTIFMVATVCEYGHEIFAREEEGSSTSSSPELTRVLYLLPFVL